MFRLLLYVNKLRNRDFNIVCGVWRTYSYYAKLSLLFYKVAKSQIITFS